jgi:N-methylhydantoinase A/oxoprolinase/acetone carboxylase beta subunit
MARSISVVTVNRGLDPRDFTLVPFGGAGPLHAAELAEILGIRRIVVPLMPGVTSGLGCLFVDLTHDVSEAMIVPLDSVDPARLQEVFGRLEAVVRQRLGDDGVSPADQRVVFAVDLRYLGQVRGLTIELLPDILADDPRGTLQDKFFAEYELQFHSYTKVIPIELAALRVHGARVFERPTLPFRGGQGELRAVDRQVVTATGEVAASVVERSRLSVGTRLSGPLVLTQADTTTWVPVGWQVEADRAGNLIMDKPTGWGSR